MKYDLEDRTLKFAIRVRKFIKTLPNSIANREDGKQVIRSSGSIGANYIEANEKLGPKDFGYRLKVARKEAKETRYWLNVIKGSNDLSQEVKNELEHLIDESDQLQKILSSIISKISN